MTKAATMLGWTLSAGYQPSMLAMIVALVALAVALVELAASVWRLRSAVSRMRAAVLALLRLVAIAAIAAIVFEVSVRIEQPSAHGRRLAVLVDRSASIALADARRLDDETVARQARLEAVWRQAENARARWREQGLELDVIGFDTEVKPYGTTTAETLSDVPVGAGSNLTAALFELRDREAQSKTPLVGIVVLSDGLVAADQASDDHLDTVVDELGVPVTTVSLGASFIRDVSVAHVRADEFAFVENVAEFEATIVGHGVSDTSVKVELRRSGEVVAEQSIRLGLDGEAQQVRFEVAPDRVGQFVYEIAVSEVSDEATVANNHRAFVVKVLRDKVRVLHVAGRPDWDVRALRTMLRRDPNVELLSYYILRGFDDISREDTSAALSLIPLPTEELFDEQLGSFDIVILHNFDAVQHQVAHYVENIAGYVAEGGGLVLIGGDLTFSDGGYARRSLATLLPVQTRGAIEFEHAPFRPELTEAGQRHPITAWLATQRDHWGGLPELDTFNPLELSKQIDALGGAVLLQHPNAADSSGNPRPLLAVSEPERGRTVVLATESTWRLGFAPELPLIGGARPYDLLWLGIVRWLLRDDTSGRLTLETDKPRYSSGEEVDLQAKALDPSYAPEPDVEIEWTLRKVALGNARDSGELRDDAWKTDALGKAGEKLAELPVGAYEVTARRRVEASGSEADGGGSHEVRRVFIVEPAGNELAYVDADPGIGRLQRLAERSGGEALSAVEGDDLPEELPLADPRERPGARAYAASYGRTVALWDGWAALALVVFGLGGEWLLRRRVGLR